jgi:hypothetical protein
MILHYNCYSLYPSCRFWLLCFPISP